jgi:hypothetical protein
MPVQLLLHQMPASTNDAFRELEPSLLTHICRGIFMFMQGWYPISTQDAPGPHTTMTERDILVFPPLGLSNRYMAFEYIAPRSSRHEARNPTYQDAERLIPRHERSLPREAGALTFYHRAIAGYLHTLQQPLEQIDHRIAELTKTDPGSEELAKAKEERTAAVMQLKEQLGNFESYDGACIISLFKQIILQAVMIETPLQQNGEPSDELPLGLHGIVKELERIQTIEAPDDKLEAIKAAASRLHQGSPLCIQPLCQIWGRYVQAPDFTRLKTKIFRL